MRFLTLVLVAVGVAGWKGVALATVVSCTAGTFHPGQPGQITCLFGQDVNDTQHDFNVAQYSTFSFTEAGSSILACNWVDQNLDCNIKDGFLLEDGVTDTVVLSIPWVADTMAGAYVCSLVSGDTEASPCNLTVTVPDPSLIGPSAIIIAGDTDATYTTGTAETTHPVDPSSRQYEAPQRGESNAGLAVFLAIFIIISVILAAGCLFLKFKYRLVRRKIEDVAKSGELQDDWDSLMFCKPVDWVVEKACVLRSRLRRQQATDEEAAQPLKRLDNERGNHLRDNHHSEPELTPGSASQENMTSPLRIREDGDYRDTGRAEGSSLNHLPDGRSSQKDSPVLPKAKSLRSLGGDSASHRTSCSMSGSQMLRDFDTRTERPQLAETVDLTGEKVPATDYDSVGSEWSESSESEQEAGSSQDAESEQDAASSKTSLVSDSDKPPRMCPICGVGSTPNPKTLSCGHTFCTQCIDARLELEPFCPECKLLQEPVYGNQPSDGTMAMNYADKQCLPGHQGTGCYIIKYMFPAAIQGDDHPCPGKQYVGTRRTAYLPDTAEGRKVLMLLKTAFDRRLVFTIGRSVNSGTMGVVWNDITHKTSMTGGTERNGYPDPDYLDLVQEELASKSVTECDLTTTMKDFIQNPRSFIRNTRDDFSRCFKTVHSTHC